MTAAQRYYRKIVRQRRALGLTTRGTARKRKDWSELGALKGHERRVERQRRERQRNIENGLTWRGTKRQRVKRQALRGLKGREYHNSLCRLLWAERRPSNLETAWRNLRAEINVNVGDYQTTAMRSEV